MIRVQAETILQKWGLLGLHLMEVQVCVLDSGLCDSSFTCN